MNKVTVRMTVAALAIAMVSGLALVDTASAAQKKKKNFFASLFSSDSLGAPRRESRRIFFGKRWFSRSGDDVKVLYGSAAQPARNFADVDPEGGSPGYGMGNLTYVADKLVALGGTSFTETRPADIAGAAIYDALADNDLGIRIVPEIKLAMIEHYRNYGFRPLWIADGKLAIRAAAVLEVLRSAAEEGMRPANYLPPVLLDYESAGSLQPGDMATLARLELGLTAMALKYAGDASGGQFDPRRLSRYHDITPERVPASQSVKVLAWSPFPDFYLNSLQPRHPAYAQMKAALADLRKEIGGTSFVGIAKGEKVKPGQSDDRLPAVRQRLASLGVSIAEPPAGPNVLDEQVTTALKEIQKSAKIGITGWLDNATVNALNNHGGERDLRRLVDNMERLRWLPKDLGKRHVLVNQPAFEVRVIDAGAEVWRSRVIVGKPDTQTAVFNDEIEMVVFNPSWGVPPSIIANEYLPKLRRDPGYLDRIGFKVTTSSGQKIASSDIDWSAYGSKVPFSIQQPPGNKNALGELKFLFPNAHNIYMHDTPNRELFEADMRAFSHGCVRVQNPREFASVLLGWDAEKIDASTDSKKSQTVRLTAKVPIHIAYFTAWPGDSGKIQYFDDIYGRDEALENAMLATTVALR